MNTTCGAIETIKARELHTVFDFKEVISPTDIHDNKSLNEWRMEDDDAPIFRYLYRNFSPSRHLEFGTWQGQGLLYCLEECSAACWTVNLLTGEGSHPDGSYIYANDPEDAAIQGWAEKIGMAKERYYHTDSIGFIGRKYLEDGYGSRVCQIYSDSRRWDTKNYPEGFFDTVLIDGSHKKDIVINDTRKALPLLRPGGLIMWHDFCPPVKESFEHTHEVAAAINELSPELDSQIDKKFWIDPSWILAGIKK